LAAHLPNLFKETSKKVEQAVEEETEDFPALPVKKVEPKVEPKKVEPEPVKESFADFEALPEGGSWADY